MRAAPVLLLACLAAAGCSRPKQLSVDHAWVRLAAVPRQPAAAYFTIHGGPIDTTLIAVNTDVAIESEMHETMASGGMTEMKPLASVPVPARSEVAFRPGGHHVMLFDVNPGIKPGGKLTLTLTFANGERILEDAAVIGAGEQPPK